MFMQTVMRIYAVFSLITVNFHKDDSFWYLLIQSKCSSLSINQKNISSSIMRQKEAIIFVLSKKFNLT